MRLQKKEKRRKNKIFSPKKTVPKNPCVVSSWENRPDASAGAWVPGL
jgi:hypothetical protein